MSRFALLKLIQIHIFYKESYQKEFLLESVVSNFVAIGYFVLKWNIHIL